jgi:hypothetical protein
MVPGLCVTIGHQLNESKRFTARQGSQFYRFEYIELNGSGKVIAKLQTINGSRPLECHSKAGRLESRRAYKGQQNKASSASLTGQSWGLLRLVYEQKILARFD